MVENVIRIKSEITKAVTVGAKIWKKFMYVKKIIFAILVHVLVKMVII